MRKSLIFIILLSLLSLTARAQMTDRDVVKYVKTAMQSGKNSQQIGKELMAKGVTVEQLKRIQNDPEYVKSSSSQTTTKANEVLDRHSIDPDSNDIEDTDDYSVLNTDNQKKNVKITDSDSPKTKTNKRNDLTDGDESDQYDDTEMDYSKLLEEYSDELPDIYGHDIFTGSKLTFEPNENLATPENYKLGPGDEVIIDVWGMNETSIREYISPEGRIMISQIGPIYLNGLTIKQAEDLIRKTAAAKFSGIEGEIPESDISLTLGQIRTVQINVMGEVNTPGTYRMSPFSSVFNAIYRAGGVSDIGTLRDIKVYRNGRIFASVDMYDYLFTGSTDKDITLREGDVVMVNPYISLVNVFGDVKRPMRYEMTGEETLADLFEYAGGFTGNAYTDNVNVVRSNGREKEIFSISKSDFSSFVLKDGDDVTIESTLDRYDNRVQISGAVFRPGQYQLGNGISTLRQLIDRAGGLTEEAFYGRAVILREAEDLMLETLSVNLGNIIDGKTSDVRLKRNDAVVIYNVHEIFEQGNITVIGEVNLPEEYKFVRNTTIEDAILMAGGLKAGASSARVDVSRRINNPSSTSKSENLAQVFSFSIVDGLVKNGDPDFTLEPFDIVAVRSSPEYKPQQIVRLQGEVMFEGEYVLQSADERLTDLIKRAGGFTQHAYLPGARLVRKMQLEETALTQSTQKLLQHESEDSLKVLDRDLKTEFRVGIQLDKAVDMPHSDYDIILRDGDRIFIPELVNTVRILGDVMYTNTVTYIEGKSVNYYINQAGGYGERAKRSKAYIVYANGTVAKVNKGTGLKPGSSIIVPSKPERKKLSASELIGIGTASASLTTMIVSLINLFK